MEYLKRARHLISTSFFLSLLVSRLTMVSSHMDTWKAICGQKTRISWCIRVRRCQNSGSPSCHKCQWALVAGRNWIFVRKTRQFEKATDSHSEDKLPSVSPSQEEGSKQPVIPERPCPSAQVAASLRPEMSTPLSSSSLQPSLLLWPFRLRNFLVIWTLMSSGINPAFVQDWRVNSEQTSYHSVSVTKLLTYTCRSSSIMWNGKVIPIYIPCQDYPVPSGYAWTHRILLEEPTGSSHSGCLWGREWRGSTGVGGFIKSAFALCYPLR